MGLKKISIQELCTGMFISELDISWQKTPFFRHKRLVTEQQDIELLKQAGVEWLVIDISKSKLSRVKSKVKIMADASSIVLEQPEAVLVEIQVETPKVKPKSFAPKVALKQELKAAKQVQNEILEAVKTLQKACERGEVISSEAVNPVVEKTLNSIDNNSQAMMALLHEGRDGSKVTMHSFGVFALVLLLSTHLEYSVEDQQELGLAALIHDAGWTKLPIHLMSKGKHYTPTEKKLVTQHITIVKKMLKDQPEISSRVMSVVEQHHEFLDGSGYPKQLKGDDIDPWSRLLTTCNEYDEMVHGLGEHPGMTPQSALSSLFRLSKKGKLDPLYTTHLISLLGDRKSVV